MVRKSSHASKKSKKGKRRVDSDDNSEDDDWNSDEETTSTVQNRATSSSGTLLHGGQPGHLVHVQPPPHQRFQVPRVQDDQDDESLFGDEAEFDAAARRQIQPQGHPHLPHQHISDMRHHANQVLHYSGGSMDDNDKHFMEQMDMYSNTFGHHQQHLPQQQNPQMGGQQPNMILNMPSLMLPNFTGVHYQPGQLPHPQLHFSGMHHMANAQGPSATSHHPSMQQHHALQVEPHQPAEEVHKLNVYTSENRKVTKIASVNLFQKVFLGRHNINPALSKPSFCPVRNELFVCGTEDQDPSKRQHNRLIFCSIDSESVVNPLFSCQIADYVRDLQWIDSQFIVFAVNQKLGLVRMSQNSLAVEDIVMFPEFHKDAIREICVSEGSKNLVISGGFDGNVFVTDISRLCTDIQKNEKKSENSLYPCRDVVGSVSWHPYDSCLASCTTDTGTIHIFDIRTDKRRPAIVYDSQKPELYTHAYKDSTTILLGYGDGQIHAFDTRIKRSFMSFQDPHQKQIGEIRFDYSMKSFAVFGVPAYTLWSFDENSLSLNAHEVIADTAMINQIPYKTSGEFRKGTGTFGVTDSLGTFCLYQMGNELR